MDYRIEPDLCVACLACVRICPSDAVAVSPERVSIVDEACTRCGVCVPTCPHEAIRATGNLDRALELVGGGRAVLILSVEAVAHFWPATQEQVVNACYAAGFHIVQRGVIGDELVAEEYLKLLEDKDWGTLIRSTDPVIVDLISDRYPELVPYLAPVANPVAAEARYLRALHGDETPIIYAGVSDGAGRGESDVALTFDDLERLFVRRGVRLHEQATYFSRIPEERRRHFSTAGGLPFELLITERQASRRFRKVRGLTGLEAIAKAVAVDRIDLGFVDILPYEGCLDHPLMGSKDGLFKRRQIVQASEPPRAAEPVVDRAVARRVQLGAVFPLEPREVHPHSDAVDGILAEIGLAPNGRAWDCGACGFITCRGFSQAAAQGRTSLAACPPYLTRRAVEAQQKAAIDALTGLGTLRLLRDRLANELARSKRSGEPFAVLFMDVDNFKQVNDGFGHEAGNLVLKGTASELLEVVRSTDFAARYGGDEFVVLLVRTGRDGARLVAEKVRSRVEELGKSLGLPPKLVTVSIGVATFAPEVEHHEDVLVAADRALYRAKAGGRNRVAMGER
ncbi:MAG TPA: diguanylate cyclase [Gemmatimonadales bacterium]|nr:diguanylate cyclase [Gemmatimonadales bacterium]